MKPASGVLLSVALAGNAVAFAAGAESPSLRAQLMAVPIDARLGGDTTVVSATEQAYGLEAPNASMDQQRLFAFGNRVFNTEWTEYPGPLQSFDGLGPTFN